MLPAQFKFLEDEGGPFLLNEALKLYGTLEARASADNPVILSWAREVGGDVGWYNKDSIPWCGLFMAVVAKRAGKKVPRQSLRARAWLKFGRKTPVPMLGDVLVFWRGRKDGPSGHVGIYVGETEYYYYVLGGNQSDSVCITRLAKSRLLEARRQYRRTPANVRRIRVGTYGKVSENEA